MMPLTLSAIVAGVVALSSDIVVSGCTYTFLRKTEDKLAPRPKTDPLKEMYKRRGAYAKLYNKD